MLRTPRTEQAPMVLLKEQASTAATATLFLWKNDSGEKVRIDKVKYVNPTGLVADAANYFVIQLKQGAVVLASWSTQTGQQGAIAANTYIDLVLSATDDDLIIDPGEALTLVLTKTGTQTLPAGTFQTSSRLIGL